MAKPEDIMGHMTLIRVARHAERTLPDKRKAVKSQEDWGSSDEGEKQDQS